MDVDSEKLEGGPEANELMVLTRKLIEIRTILMSIDHGETLVLPSIVVIGRCVPLRFVVGLAPCGLTSRIMQSK